MTKSNTFNQNLSLISDGNNDNKTLNLFNKIEEKP